MNSFAVKFWRCFRHLQASLPCSGWAIEIISYTKCCSSKKITGHGSLETQFSQVRLHVKYTYLIETTLNSSSALSNTLICAITVNRLLSLHYFRRFFVHYFSHGSHILSSPLPHQIIQGQWSKNRSPEPCDLENLLSSWQSGRAMPLDQIIEDEDFPDSHKLSQLEASMELSRIADVKGECLSLHLDILSGLRLACCIFIFQGRKIWKLINTTKSQRWRGFNSKYRKWLPNLNLINVSYQELRSLRMSVAAKAHWTLKVELSSICEMHFVLVVITTCIVFQITVSALPMVWYQNTCPALSVRLSNLAWGQCAVRSSPCDVPSLFEYVSESRILLFMRNHPWRMLHSLKSVHSTFYMLYFTISTLQYKLFIKEACKSESSCFSFSSLCA